MSQENQNEEAKPVLDKELFDSTQVAYEFMSSLSTAFVDLIETTLIATNSNAEEESKVILKELKEFLTVSREYQTKLSRYENVGNQFIDTIKGFEKALILLESKMVQMGFSLE